MNKTFPESINTIDINNSPESLATIRDYINYMCERIDYTLIVIEKLYGISNSTSTTQRLAELESELNDLAIRVSVLENT